MIEWWLPGPPRFREGEQVKMTARWGKITALEIVSATKGRLIHGDPHKCFAGFNSDSRNLNPGELFWALKGDRFDGHDFVKTAISQGAAGAVVEEGSQVSRHHPPDIAMIAVHDTLKALGDLAAWWRRQHTAKLVAITGSSGKTTVKEMTAAIFQAGSKTLKNPGNHNNLIGLPVTLLRLEETHERAVIEMGMNRRGEIGRLTEIANPDAAAILNVGMAHLEGLGDMDGVAEAKTELIANASPGTKIIVNGDDALLMKHAEPFGRELFTFGMQEENRVQCRQLQNEGPKGIRFDLCWDEHTLPIRLSVAGIHNVKNALAAAAIALCLDTPAEHISEGLGMFRGIKGRFQSIALKGDILLIDDTYNANPSALKAAIDSALGLVPEDGNFLVGIGDMLELGEAAVPAHREAGRRIARSGAARLFAMGKHAGDLKRGAVDAGMPANRVVIAQTHEELVEKMIAKTGPKDVVFLKGSRRMRFEKISEGLKMHFGNRFSE